MTKAFGGEPLTLSGAARGASRGTGDGRAGRHALLDVSHPHRGRDRGAVLLPRRNPALLGERASEGRLPHFGLQVDDVAAALEQVERAGGRRMFERVERWGRARVVYVADPDGNVIELLDAPVETIAEEAIRMFPDAAPFYQPIAR